MVPKGHILTCLKKTIPNNCLWFFFIDHQNRGRKIPNNKKDDKIFRNIIFWPRKVISWKNDIFGITHLNNVFTNICLWIFFITHWNSLLIKKRDKIIFQNIIIILSRKMILFSKNSIFLKFHTLKNTFIYGFFGCRGENKPKYVYLGKRSEK